MCTEPVAAILDTILWTGLGVLRERAAPVSAGPFAVQRARTGIFSE